MDVHGRQVFYRYSSCRRGAVCLDDTPILRACSRYILPPIDSTEWGAAHRDIKPSNLIVSPDGQVKVLDFGLARAIEDHVGDESITLDSVGLGTPDYMAPEQFRDARRVDRRADIYSLGCTLYRCLADRVPFPAPTVTEKAHGHQSEEPEPLERMAPDSPIGLNVVCRKMMSKRPEDRYQSMRDVANSLAGFVSGGSPSRELVNETISWVHQQSTGERQRTLVKWLAGSTVVLSIALAALFFFKDRRFAQVGDYSRQPISVHDHRETEAKPQTPSHSDPMLLTVAKSGAQYSSITDALRDVKPGMTIRVLDDAIYSERITVGRRSRHTGVTIEAVNGARITLDQEIQPMEIGRELITIDGVRDLRFRGFTILAPRQSRIVRIHGDVSGSLIEDLTIVCGSPNQPSVGINLFEVSGTEPIIVRNCRIKGVTYGIASTGRRPGPILRSAQARTREAPSRFKSETAVHVSARRVYGAANRN